MEWIKAIASVSRENRNLARVFHPGVFLKEWTCCKAPTEDAAGCERCAMGLSEKYPRLDDETYPVDHCLELIHQIIASGLQSVPPAPEGLSEAQRAERAKSLGVRERKKHSGSGCGMVWCLCVGIVVYVSVFWKLTHCRIFSATGEARNDCFLSSDIDLLHLSLPFPQELQDVFARINAVHHLMQYVCSHCQFIDFKTHKSFCSSRVAATLSDKYSHQHTLFPLQEAACSHGQQVSPTHVRSCAKPGQTLPTDPRMREGTNKEICNLRKTPFLVQYFQAFFT